MRSSTPRKLTTMFFMALVALFLSVGTAQASAPTDDAGGAGALGCGHAWSNKDPGFGHVIPAAAAMHTGPHASCTVLLNVSASDGLDYHCYVWNESGNTWTHVRISNTNIEGWIFDDYLTGGGSVYQC